MTAAVPRPYGLLAELTHRCPLHCPYCSNPIELISRNAELPTADWNRVLREAADLGVLHVGFSGGEPLLRTDLSELVTAARACGLYSNLITSSLGLTPARTQELKEAGLDSIQISFQSDDRLQADRIAGIAAHARKIEAARMAREVDLPLTVNVVIHRGNIERLESIIALAVEVGAQRLELANTQYDGWAFKNRSQLLPSRNQVEKATQIAAAAKKSLLGKLEILFVIPDYYSDRPKPCMHGWGNRHLTVNPAGNVLPCPTAGEIPGLKFDNVRDHSLQWIWSESEAFNRFRGTEWMSEPCRSCEFREVDFGGCRCQAALLTGEAGVTDPACALSPFRDKLTSFVNSIEESRTPQPEGAEALSEPVYRQNPAV